jgi:hypothetical protein
LQELDQVGSYLGSRGVELKNLGGLFDIRLKKSSAARCALFIQGSKVGFFWLWVDGDQCMLEVDVARFTCAELPKARPSSAAAMRISSYCPYLCIQQNDIFYSQNDDCTSNAYGEENELLKQWPPTAAPSCDVLKHTTTSAPFLSTKPRPKALS